MSDEIPVGLYLLRRIRELGCKTVQGLPGLTLGMKGNGRGL